MAWYTYIAMGGGIFALRRPRPYSRHCGEGVAMHAASTIIYAHAGGPLCAYRQPSSPCGRRAIINGNGVEADNDARAASL